MKKKYFVELTEDERSTLREVVKKLKGTSGKVKRATILLKADAKLARERAKRKLRQEAKE